MSNFANPWTVTCQAPLSMEFSRQEYWSGELFPSPGDLPNLGIEPGTSALQIDSLLLSLRLLSHQFPCVWLFVTSWTVACQSMPFTICQSLLRLMPIESVMLYNHLILFHPLLLLPSIFPSIRVFSNESALHITCTKYWSFRFIISPSNELSGLISFRTDWFDLLLQ